MTPSALSRFPDPTPAGSNSTGTEKPSAENPEADLATSLAHEWTNPLADHWPNLNHDQSKEHQH